MLKMYRKHRFLTPVANQSGVGLITAIFVIVVVGMFGVLIARYAAVSSVASAEDYLWAQSLYSAQSAAHVTILYADGGGSSGSSSLSTVEGFAVTTSSITSGVRATAERDVNGKPIKRTIEMHYSL